MTREEKVIEEVEREHEKERIKITEQDKFMGNLAKQLNPIFEGFFTELLKNIIGSDAMNDKIINECNKAIKKIFVQKTIKAR